MRSFMVRTLIAILHGAFWLSSCGVLPPSIEHQPMAYHDDTFPLAPTPTYLTYTPTHSLSATLPLTNLADHPPVSPTLIALPERQRLFDQVWQTIDQNYLYPDFRGHDWEAIRHEFASHIETVQTNEEFYVLLSNMVSRLDDDHSRFLAPGDVAEETAINTGYETYVGIGIITITKDDGMLIQHVFPNSPAAQAGIRPRDHIIAIDGVPYAEGVTDIRGMEGIPVQLTIVRPGELPRDVTIMRRAIKGHIAPRAHRLTDDIGYLVITTLWVNDMTEQVSGALTDLVVERPLRGLIIDLRGNPGGWRDVLAGVLSHFVQGEVGFFFDRHHTTPLVVRESSGPDLRGLPLVVLIDAKTASYAEVLAGVLQVEAGAVVIGVPSSGNTETIYAYDMGNGARLWVAQEGFVLRNGIDLEGHGVQPDVVLDLDWTGYPKQDDPQILAALALLEEQAGRPFAKQTDQLNGRFSGTIEQKPDRK